MTYFENKCIEVDNNFYEIIESVEYENRYFVYLVNREDELDSMFKEIIVNNNELIDIDNELFKEKIVGLFFEKFSSY